MSALSALYDAYVRAEKDNFIDRHDLNDHHIVILPLFHTNRRSDGLNIVELNLNPDGSVIDCDFVPADDYAVFPVTEESVTRTVNVSAHPLCDQLGYTSAKFKKNRFDSFMDAFQSWYNYAQENGSHPILESVHALLEKQDMFDAVFNGLRQKYPVALDEKDNFIVTIDGKEKKIKTDGLLVTYRVFSGRADKLDYTSTADTDLHRIYVDYIRHLNSEKKDQFDYCDLSGDYAYCTNKHRGLLGTAKVVSVSHSETHMGRFRSGDEVVRLSYEATEKIHLMLKFFLDHGDNNAYLGESTYTLIWFDNDLFNKDKIDITSPGDTVEKYDPFSGRKKTPKKQATKVDTLSSRAAQKIGNSMIGLREILPPKGRFYILIINKISNGRIAVQYFRELSNSELMERLAYWYASTAWPRYVKDTGLIERSPNLFEIIDSLYGDENEKGYVRCENKKLRTLAFKRLLPCVIDGRPLPKDFARLAYINFTKRNSYDKSWPQILYIACALLNKTRCDRNQRRIIQHARNIPTNP